MKKLLIISYTSSTKDPRVFKEWTFLKDFFDITIAGWQPCIPGADFIEIRKNQPNWKDKLCFALGMLLGNPKPFLNSFQLDRNAVKGKKFDLVLCNDLFPLPLAFELAQGAPVFWDAHEYYPEEHEDSLLWRIVFKRVVCKIAAQYIPRVSAMSTVCPAIAERYEHEYGKKTILVRNTPFFNKQTYRPVKDKIKLVYVGNAHPGRKIDHFVRMMKHLDERFTLDFYLVAYPDNQKKIKRMARGDSRIHFHEPVSLNQLCTEINQYDIGLSVFFPLNYNFEKGLPNKLFEYVQGRLGIFTGPSSEICSVTNQYGNGISSVGFAIQDFVKTLSSLSIEQVQELKKASDRAAWELCAERELPKLKDALLALTQAEMEK